MNRDVADKTWQRRLDRADRTTLVVGMVAATLIALVVSAWLDQARAAEQQAQADAVMRADIERRSPCIRWGCL